MENAVRYGRRGGHLVITLRRGEGATIDFVDDGPGVARHFFYRKCLNVLPARRRPAPDTPAEAASIIHCAICVAHGISASLPASGGLQIRVVLPYAPARRKTACLDNPLTQRRAILDECVM